MGKGVDFEGANKTFHPPKGDEDRCSPMRVFANGRVLVECWELSPDELAEINRTGRVYLSVHSNFLTPMFLGSESTVRDLVADYGGAWPRSRAHLPNETKG